MAASVVSNQEQVNGQPGGVKYSLHLANCLEWMDSRPPNSVHAIVTDPPYGLKEFTASEKHKLRKGKGGVWRIPPSFDGCKRSPVPRFTILSEDERAQLKVFFADFARRAIRVLVPGGHVFIATNPLLSHLVYLPLMEVGFEPGKIAAIWRVDTVFLRQEDWKYEGSKAAEGLGGRTHTFGMKLPATLLRKSIVYQNPRVIVRQGGPVLTDVDI